jgi:hypothetical protein
MRTLLIIGAAVLAGACHAGGNAEEADARPTAQRAFEVGAFDRIALSGSPDVIVAVGGAPSVRAEGDADLIERLEVVVENGRLKIGVRERSGRWFSFRHHSGVTLHVTVPSLAGAAIEGSGDIRIDRVQGTAFNGSIAGSGDLEIGALAVGEANFSVAGSGGIRGAGSAERATISVAGSGDIDLVRLEAGDATVSLAGSGDIGIRATRTAAIDLRGSGDINVAGPARCTISKAGSGDVRCGG